MILKEKQLEDMPEGAPLRHGGTRGKEKKHGLSPAAGAIASCLCGVMFGGAFSGGTAIPVCTALTAAVSPTYGLCIFIGLAASCMAAGRVGSFAAEITAAAILVCIRFAVQLFFGSCKTSARTASVTAGAVYFLSGIAEAFFGKITPVVIAAVFFRSVICGTVAYFASSCAEEVTQSGRISVTGERGVPAAVMYILGIAALSGVSFGSFCAGRAFGIFMILAAGGRFGGTGAASAGVLTALGIILAESGGAELPDMVRSMAVVNCAGLIAGCVSGRGRTASSAAFSVSAMLLTLFMGKIQWAAELMTDTLTAAALYCLVPDRLYMGAVNGTVKRDSAVLECCGNAVRLTAKAIDGVRSSVSKAAELLAEINGEEKEIDIAEEACRKICGECRNSEFCCSGRSRRVGGVFADAVRILGYKGHITEKELPKALEGCTKKAEIAEFFNDCARMNRMTENGRNGSAVLRECIDEQLSAAGDMLGFISGELTEGRIYDENLSEKVKFAAERFGGKNPSAAVYFDVSGHIFISCCIEGRLESPVEEMTDRLSSMTDRELDKPEVFSEDGFMRICWHEFPAFRTETGKAVLSGREEVSGDSSAEFSDGFGCVYYLIADGMGSGSRAALESGMAASLLSKLIRSGTGVEAALKTVNLILLSKSDDEIFTTADLLRINLFSGRADIFKAGAAKSFIRTGGTVKTAESASFPLGIMPRIRPEQRTLRLSDGDCAVMFSDGISEDSFPRLRELILSDGYSPQRCADAMIDYDKNIENAPSDDRTVIVVKLHKI